MKRGLFAKLRKRQKGKQALTKPNPSDLVFNTIDITDVKTMVDQYYPENWPVPRYTSMTSKTPRH